MKNKFSTTLTGMLWAFLSGSPAIADDTELFVSGADQAAQPNILLIIDTSSSMEGEVLTQPTYDSGIAYAGSCSPDRIYWRTGAGDPPACDTDRWLEASSLVCNAALDAYERSTGFYTDLMGQYDPEDQDRWERIDPTEKGRLIECQADSGLHGDTTDTGTAAVYARNGDDSNPWSNNPLEEVSWGQAPVDQTYSVFDGNYLNWYYGTTTVSTRIQVVKDVATDLLNSLDGVNVGLMQFNSNQGGPVIHAMETMDTARDSLVSTVEGLELTSLTPLSETLYEAGQYFAGRAVDFGNRGSNVSVPESRQIGNPNVYSSPLEYGCQKNFAVLLTDGRPRADVDADSKITGLPGFSALVSSNGCDGEGDGACLDDMADYMYTADLDPVLPGKQNVVTYTIGFTIDLPLLATTAARGGGEYFTADDTATLSAALNNIVSSVLSTQSTFTSPTVSINSFNRTQTLNDLYLTVFEASGSAHWPGNLKKYRLSASSGLVLDADGNVAIDAATRSFVPDSRSFWSASADGANVSSGGAANQLPGPVDREIYTYLGSPLLTDSSNNVDSTNIAITDALLGVGSPGDPSRENVISFIRGTDITDTNQNGNLTEPRNQMGDPLHASPVSIIYGGSVSNPDVNDAVVFFSTNDGFLHAIDPNTGIEKWAFIPPEFLQDQTLLYRNEPQADKHYGVDGSMQVQLLADNNGVIEPGLGEKVYLYFGMRRGGATYYALDVTNPESPRLMWRSDSSDLPGLGQSWSTPVPTRLAVQGASQNADNLVLVVGGGYDPSQDNDAGSTDSSGNALYILDSVSGDLLWHASSNNAVNNHAAMQYSFPSDLKVLDLDGDTFADRIYAADMGGQVWRFDLFNGSPASSLVSGGVIAQLGGAPLADPAIADNRRFYYAPDIAAVTDDNNSFLHIGIGSGHRAHPNGTLNQDRFYALRDYNAFGARSQIEYDALTPFVDDDLVNVTDDIAIQVPIGSPGWRLELRNGGWQGEKVLAEARTFNNEIIFTTFTPGAAATANDCEPSLGTNRLYALDIFNGAPVNNLDGIGDEDQLTITDRSMEFEGSIASEAILLFPSPDDPNCVGEQCTPPPLVCVDLMCFSAGFTNAPVRTFWSQDGVQ